VSELREYFDDVVANEMSRREGDLEGLTRISERRLRRFCVRSSPKSPITRRWH